MSSVETHPGDRDLFTRADNRNSAGIRCESVQVLRDSDFVILTGCYWHDSAYNYSDYVVFVDDDKKGYTLCARGDEEGQSLVKSLQETLQKNKIGYELSYSNFITQEYRALLQHQEALDSQIGKNRDKFNLGEEETISLGLTDSDIETRVFVLSIPDTNTDELVSLFSERQM